MRGLTWSHVWWWAVSLTLLWGIAAADSPFTINFTIFPTTYKAVKTGWENFNKAEDELAKRTDAQINASKSGNPRDGICDGEKTEHTPLSFVTLSGLKGSDQSRESAIALLGQPYCKSHDGEDVWIFNDGRYYKIAKYKPIVAQLY